MKLRKSQIWCSLTSLPIQEIEYQNQGVLINISVIDRTKEYSKPLEHDIYYFFPSKEMRSYMDLFFGENEINGNID